MAGPMNMGNSKTTHSGEYKKIVIWICTIAALGGLLFGLDIGFIANALPVIENIYHLGDAGGESYAAVLATGGVAGALLSGFFARFLGRKKSLILAGLLFSSLSLISATVPAFEILKACRFGIGFAVGVSSFIVPLYLSETAPASIRGSMGTLFQLMITIGIFLVAVVNVAIANTFANPHVALPMMFMVVGAFSILMFVGSFLLPESPRWLVLKGRKKEALAVLDRVMTNQDDIDHEIRDIEHALEGARGVSFGGIFKGYFIKIVLMGVVLQMFQQLVVINMMIYYSPKIFGYAGMTGLIAMLTVPTVNMLFTFPAIKLVEKWGRKKLLYLGSIVMLITMVAAGLAFMSIGNVTDPSQIGALPKMILLVSVILYIFGFAVSWGPVAWLVCSEVFPLEVREVGMTVTTIVNWTFAGLVMGNALSFMKEHGTSSIFFVFAGFCVLSMIFLKFFVPETKGVTLEQIEENLKAGVAMKDLGS